MILVSGTISAISPLHFGNGRARGTFSQTLSYIPGRTIRGMVGWYLYQYNRELFDSCGLSEDHDYQKMKVFFRNAYPLAGEERPVYSPLSARWCKKCQSLIPGALNECGMVTDGRQCLQEGKKYSGLISRSSLSKRRLVPPSPVATRLETKCPITRDGHTSMGGDWQLSPYHIESIEPGSRFGFVMLADESVVDDVIACLSEASYACGLGGFRSRGYGLVDFSVGETVSLDDAARARASDLTDSAECRLVLNAPCIIRDGASSVVGFDDRFFAAARERLSSSGFSADIKPADPAGVQVSRATVRGWSLKNGNMVDELIPATGPGSCLLVTGSAQSLAALELLGVGDMLSQGYGELYIGGA